MENSVKQRLILFIKNKNISQSKFEKAVGLSNGFVNNISKGIGADKLQKILCVYPDLNQNWLLTGEGEMLLSDVTKSDAKYKGTYLNENLTMVRYVPIGAAASFVESLWNEEKEMGSIGVLAEEGEELNDDYVVFQVNGDSMEPGIHDKSLILAKRIDEGQWEQYEGCVVVIVYENILTVKRIKENRLYAQNFLVLSADNPGHGERRVERCDIRGMWKAERIISQRIM